MLLDIFYNIKLSIILAFNDLIQMAELVIS